MIVPAPSHARVSTAFVILPASQAAMLFHAAVAGLGGKSDIHS